MFRSIQSKLILLTTIITVSLGLIVVFTYLRLEERKSQIETIYRNNFVSSSRLKDIHFQINQVSKTCIDYLANNIDAIQTFSVLTQYSKGDSQQVALSVLWRDYQEANIDNGSARNVESVQMTEKINRFLFLLNETCSLLSNVNSESDKLNANMVEMFVLQQSLHPIFISMSAKGESEIKSIYNKVLSEFISDRNIIFILMAIQILVAVGLTVSVNRKIIRDIHEFLSRIKTISEGGGNLTKKVENVVHQELSEMAIYFNKFLEKLEEIVAAARDVTKVVSVSVKQVSSTSKELSVSALQQSDNISSIAAVMAQCSSALGQMTETTGQVKRSTENASNVIASGNESIDVLTDQMQRVVINQKNLSKKINEITEKSNQISTISRLIEQIGQRTNVLSINAAINAAREGKLSKAVVDEIKSVAEQSRSSAIEIDSILRTIQTNILAINEDVNRDSERISQLSEQVLETKNVFTRIDSSLNTVRQMANSISDFIVQQNTIIQDAALSTNSLSVAGAQTSVAISDLADSASQLSMTTEHLSSLMSKFVINKN
ncbi:methyl-accepting chemotaxis protein [bacterium]|nr:methyl-accepting chemotaxis protein [bacterium]